MSGSEQSVSQLSSTPIRCRSRIAVFASWVRSASRASLRDLRTRSLIAANRSLLGGGGVDGAIHRAAGPELLAECRTLNGCETGEAKITKGYRLPAKYVIHTVGPVYSGGPRDAELLRNCYINSLNLAKDNDIRSIAFPAISTGVYGYPKREAAEIAVKTAKAWLEDNAGYDIKICFVSFDSETYGIYQDICC